MMRYNLLIVEELNRMPPSDAQKKAAKKYKAKNIRQFRIDFNLEEYTEFEEYCARIGVRPTTLIKTLIKETIKNHPDNTL